MGTTKIISTVKIIWSSGVSVTVGSVHCTGLGVREGRLARLAWGLFFAGPKISLGVRPARNFSENSPSCCQGTQGGGGGEGGVEGD